MTPRQQDIAFVLERVPGVLDVFAIAKPNVDLDFVIRLDHGGAHLAAAHYALLRVLTRSECRRVLFYEIAPPPGLEPALRRLVLTDSQRRESTTRVPQDLTPEASEETHRELRRHPGAQFSALLVDCSDQNYRAVVTALGVAAHRVIEKDPTAAAKRALEGEEHDLLLCSVRSAFGPNGFLDTIRAKDATLASRVVLIAEPREHRLVRAALDTHHLYNTCLPTAFDPALLLQIAQTGSLIAAFGIPVPSVRAPRGELRTPRARVLVLDDGAEAHALDTTTQAFDLDVTADPWLALDALATYRPDLIVCSATLRTGPTPLYRQLWTKHPELKARCVLLVPPDTAPNANAIARPLTLDKIAAALESRLSPRD